MRTTGDFERLQLWRSLFDEATLRADRLVAARGESVFRDRSGAFGLDLTFVRDDGTCVVIPAIMADTIALARKNRNGFVWPRAAAAALTDAAAGAIEDRLSPWLRSLVRGRSIAGEFVRRYAPCPPFETARSRGLLGAASYGESLVRLAPVLFAQRYGARASALVRGSESALWAAGIRLQCAAIEHDADADGAIWFALAPSQSVERPDLAIVDDPAHAAHARFAIAVSSLPESWRSIEVPRPVPLDVFTTFDRADAPVVATFAVRGVEGAERVSRSTVPASIVGGSRGIVRVAVRDDAFAARDCDTDEAEELVARLAAEGMDALAISYSRAMTETADLVHFYATFDDPAFLRAAEKRRLSGLAYVVTLAPLTPWTTWAEEGHFYLGQVAHDDGRERSYRRAFERKLLVLDGVPHQENVVETAAREERFTTIVNDAAGIFLAAGEDVGAFCARYPGVDPLRVAALAPFFGADAEPADLGALVGDEPFVLMHGAMLHRNRHLPVLTALARAGIPCVVAGPLADVYLGVTIRRFGGERAVFLTDPSREQLTTLYRRAALFVDASPRPHGYARLVRASLCGARPIVASDSPAVRLFAGTTATFEAIAIDSVGATLRAAFAANDDRALHVARAQAAVARHTDVDGAFAAVAAAYARS